LARIRQITGHFRFLADFRKNLSNFRVTDSATLSFSQRGRHMANSIVHFEIFATDVERARKFYQRVFGWKFEVAGPPDFYLIVTGPETDPGLKHGLIAKRSGPAAEGPINSFRCTISVHSITESMTAVEAAGGKLRSDVVEIPDVGKVVEIEDSENNIVCLLQPVAGQAPAAK
jgi:predicted enzyme related to lactoylglutathione lyase